MSSIKRSPHRLQREKSMAMPRHVIFFDTETREVEVSPTRIEHHLKLGWACYYRKAYGRHLTKADWFYFTTPSEFWQFVSKHTEPKRKLWIIARNVVFDFTVVEGWRHLRQADFKVRFFHNEGTTTIISVRGKQGSIVFVDSMNWFRESLAETGKRIGIPKLVIDFKTCTMEYLSLYCKRDVEIELENFIQFVRFLEANAISRLCFTIGSTAMAAYLFSHYKRSIYIHNNKEALDLERGAFKGGRVECFYLGELNNGNFSVVDVNSLYPSVMRDNSYPVKYVKKTHSVTKKDLGSYLKTYCCIAKVMVNTDEPIYAVRRDRTIFPVGKFWVTLTTPELKYALSQGHILKIDDIVVYESADIFREYVDRFYRLRQDFVSAGVGVYSEICKLLLNSLYGKFGQKADEWRKIGNCPNEPDRVEVLYNYGSCRYGQLRYLLGEIFELVGHGESYNSFPAISAHVTAYGRLRLWEIMKLTGEGNYFYCDTDSLIINEVGLCHLQNQIDAVNLGLLKVVETTPKVVIRGLKDYSTKEKIVVKGIRKNAVEVRQGVYRQELWPTFKGLLRDTSTSVYTVKRMVKVLTRNYTKGDVSSNGWVTPYVLAEPDVSPQQLC